MPSIPSKSDHRWCFRRFGGFDQIAIESGEDIRHLPELDPKLWAVLSCPVEELECDARTLQLLDTDNDGRIRVGEVQEAVRWICRRIKNPGDLFEHRDSLPLDAIDDSTEEGHQILAGVFRILDHLGRTEAGGISAADIADTAQIFAGTRFNGDGIIYPGSTRDPAVASAIADIIRCVGSIPDRSGEPGIDQALCERFFGEAAQYLDWWAEAEADPERLLPLGRATEAAAEVLIAVASKIDDYFTRVRLVEYDPQAASLLNPAPDRYATLSAQDIAPDCPALADWPLARIEPGWPLPLCQGINPHWSGRIDSFRAQVVVPLLGPLEALTEDQWQRIKARLAPYLDWRARQRGGALASLGPERIRELLQGPYKDAIASLIEQDLELAGISEAIEAVERAVHYYQHLETLLQNFVTLRDLYTPGRQAIFQAGTLYLDGRACSLCVRVEDIDCHAELARHSGIYLAYCRCRRRAGAQTQTIAAAFTAGDADNLMVGRKGLFYDRQGRDWDATIVRIIEHPISLTQAFWSPYQRLGRLISQQIDRLASAQAQALDTQAQPGLARLVIAKFAGILAAIGLAVGALTALVSIILALLALDWWQLLLFGLGLGLAVSGLSILHTYLKLRRRNLAPLLDACGWAVNARPKISPRFGSTLTYQAYLPKGAVRLFQDPLAEPSYPWRSIALLLLVIAALVAGLWAVSRPIPWGCLGPLSKQVDQVETLPPPNSPAQGPSAGALQVPQTSAIETPTPSSAPGPGALPSESADETPSPPGSIEDARQEGSPASVPTDRFSSEGEPADDPDL